VLESLCGSLWRVGESVWQPVVCWRVCVVACGVLESLCGSPGAGGCMDESGLGVWQHMGWGSVWILHTCDSCACMYVSACICTVG
jgi:hypothetical protein